MATASASQRVPVEERLFSLVLALLATEHGLTKNDILSTVQGYRQRYQPGGDNSNLERQFERDKDDIRELGVPLETIELAVDAGNNQNLRYRIPRGAYELPRDLRFSAEETALLGLASMVWREGSMSAESRRAVVKLRSLGMTTSEPVLSYLPRVRVRDAAFDPLSSALEKHRVVRFNYLKPGESVATVRTVAPLALYQFQGRWHLGAMEQTTMERKTFLLRRIVSAVTITTTPSQPPAPDEAARGLAELQSVWESNLAVVAVEPNTDAATRLFKQRGAAPTQDGKLGLHFVDINVIADELASYGPEVTVLSPTPLRTMVLERMLATAADHGQGSAGSTELRGAGNE